MNKDSDKMSVNNNLTKPKKFRFEKDQLEKMMGDFKSDLENSIKQKMIDKQSKIPNKKMDHVIKNFIHHSQKNKLVMKRNDRENFGYVNLPRTERKSINNIKNENEIKRSETNADFSERQFLAFSDFSKSYKNYYFSSSSCDKTIPRDYKIYDQRNKKIGNENLNDFSKNSKVQNIMKNLQENGIKAETDRPIHRKSRSNILKSGKNNFEHDFFRNTTKNFVIKEYEEIETSSHKPSQVQTPKIKDLEKQKKNNEKNQNIQKLDENINNFSMQNNMANYPYLVRYFLQ